MIIGFGSDIVVLSQLGRILGDPASVFLESTFTAREIAYARSASSGDQLRHLAARFAAKEAVLKAFGSAGLEDAPPALQEIEVVRSSAGAPSLSLTGRAESAALALGVTRSWLTLSHDGDYALASVLFERTNAYTP